MEFNLQHLCYSTFQKAYTSITYRLSHDKSTYGQVSISQSFKIATKTADISLVIISKTNGTFQTTSLYNPPLSPLSQSLKTSSHFQKTKKKTKQNQNPQNQIVPSVTFSVTFEGKKKCQLDSENAAKSATLWGSAKCWDGGATRHGFQPIAYRPMCRRDTWRSAWAAVAGDSWCVRRTWTIPSSKSSWSKLKRSTGSTTKARWRFRATSRYSRKCSDSFRDPSRVRTVITRPGSWISRIFRGTATWASGTTLTSGLNLDRCFMGSPTKLSGNAFRRNFYLKKIIIIKKALCFWPGCDSVRVSSHPRKEKKSSQLSIILAKRIATDSAELANPDGDFYSLLFIEFFTFFTIGLWERR